MTWAEFKRQVEAFGVKDDDPIYYIELGTLSPSSVMDVQWYEGKEEKPKRGWYIE